MPRNTNENVKSGWGKKIATKLSDWFGKPKERTWIDVMKDYEITPVVLDEDHIKFYYKKRLLGRLFPVVDDMGRPIYKIYLYLYKSDKRNTKWRFMKKLDPDEEIEKELMRQTEKPYFKLGKTDFSADDLIWQLITTWIYQTDAGWKRTQYLNEFYAEGEKRKLPSEAAKKLLVKNEAHK